jgi:gliding-associated putative ABC transporter substrate-binding component GldG
MADSTPSRRKTLLFSGTGAVLVLLILATINVLSHFLFVRRDFSSGKVYSISPGTRDILSRITDKLVIKVYFTAHLPSPYGLHAQYLKDLLGEYKSVGRGGMSIEFINPEGNERLRREALETGLLPVQINVMGRDKFEVKEALMGAVFLYQGRTETLPVLQNTAELEYDITRRIKKLVFPEMKTVGFLTGHGERGPADGALQPLFELMREQMNVEAVTLDKPLPAKIDSLWILGPNQKFKTEELERLKAWANSGRSLGLLLSRRAVDLQSFYSTPIETGLESLLKAWGVELREGLVADAQSEKIQLETQYGQFVAMRIQEYPFIPVSTNLNASHPATRKLKTATFPFAHPISFSTGPAGLKFTSLADSSRYSWYQTTHFLAPNQPAEKLETQQKGPFSLAGIVEGDFFKVAASTAAAREGSSNNAPGRLILVGTSYQFHPSMANKAANVAFIMNLLEWSFQDEALLSIRAKGLSYRPLRRLPDAQRLLIKHLLVWSLPIGLLLLGFASYRRQATRRKLLAALYAEAKKSRGSLEPAGRASDA